MRLRSLPFTLALTLLCGACAAPVASLPPLSKDSIEVERRQEQIEQIRTYYAALRRVDNVAFRIRGANAADCKDWVSPQIGLYAATQQSLPRKFRSYSSEALKVSWSRPTVISVAEDSPAAKAGIAAGDEIIALDGELIPATGTASFIGGWLKHHGLHSLSANVRHDGLDRTVTIEPVIGCAIPINYVMTDEANAFTSDARIVINSGIVALAETDAQLAVIIGHELAHSNLGHLNKRRWNTVVGWVGGTLVDAGFLSGGVSTGGAFRKAFEKAGARAYSVGFEREADYVGAYYAARAGYELTGAEEIWRKLGQSHPESLRLARTHPTTPERFVQMQAVAAEITNKKRRHLPLVPELKTPQFQDGPAPERTGDF